MNIKKKVLTKKQNDQKDWRKSHKQTQNGPKKKSFKYTTAGSGNLIKLAYRTDD